MSTSTFRKLILAAAVAGCTLIAPAGNTLGGAVSGAVATFAASSAQYAYD